MEPPFLITFTGKISNLNKTQTKHFKLQRGNVAPKDIFRRSMCFNIIISFCEMLVSLGYMEPANSLQHLARDQLLYLWMKL